MFDWISHNKELFLQSHTEIGRSYQHAVELQTQHNHFTMNSMVTNGNRSVGVRSQWRRGRETVAAGVAAPPDLTDRCCYNLIKLGPHGLKMS